MSRPYAIIVGRNKTGTTSFIHALRLAYGCPADGAQQWNYRDLVKLYKTGQHDKLVSLAKRSKVIKDHPWNQGDIYKRLAEAYPDAIFCLTVRDPDSWYQSKLRFISQLYNPRDYPDPTSYMMKSMRHMWREGVEDFRDADSAKQAYINRNDEIQSYFEQKPSVKFFRVNVPEDMNWVTVQRITQIDENVLKKNIMQWQSEVLLNSAYTFKVKGGSQLPGSGALQTLIKNRDDNISEWAFPCLNKQSRTGTNIFDYKNTGLIDVEARDDYIS